MKFAISMDSSYLVFCEPIFLDEKEHEINLVFHTEDWWIADIAVFVSEAPSKLNIVAMEDTVVFIISRENLGDFVLKKYQNLSGF
ncbi:MAG: hypothetical protein IPO64_17680 [Bacteroidetes bacterium]|nr:hypothetical protein [Bacteroidota bacterium]